MAITSVKLYKLALIIIFFIAIFLIYNYLTQRPTIIERENMDGLRMIDPMYQDWIVPKEFYYKNNYFYANRQKQDPASKPDFYFKNKKYDFKYKDPLNFDNDQECGNKFNWDTPMSPGSNNQYNDLLWSYMSPKMILEDDCINCKKFSPSNSFNEPMGISSNLTNLYDGTMEDGFLKDQKILDDSFVPSNLATGNKYISQEIANKYLSPQ